MQIEEVFADGYSSGEALKSLEENNITGYFPNFGQNKSSREGFSYDKENDRYICKIFTDQKDHHHITWL